MSKLGWTDSGFVKNQTLKSTDLTASDYAWFTKNADGTFTAMTGDPINAGTYYLKLKDSSEAKLKAENPNYNLTINGEFTYTINPVSGTATLSGSASKIYDGKDISLDDLNSPDGDIEVKFTFSGSTVADTYKLRAGDYTIENNSAKADDYTVSLSTDGLARLQAAIDNYAGAGNVTLAAKDLSSNASFTIKQKDLTVTLDKKPNTTPGKTYDDQTATIDDNDAQFTAAGLVEGQTLNVANLTPSDYEWVDKDGKKLDKVPTDAGTYYIALTQAGVKQLQKDNPNYKVSESGQFAYVIAKAEAKVEINGSYEGTSTAQDAKIYRNAVVDEVTGKVTYGAWSTGNWGPFTTPTIDGYTPTIASIATKPVTYGTDPESVDITYTPNAQTTNIIYKDEDGQTIKTDKVDGKTDETVDVHSIIPAGWKLVDGQDVPETVKFGPNGHPDIPVVIEHKTITVTPETPEDKIPTGKVPVKTPNETSDDTEIDTTPKDQDLESGPAVIKGYEENNAPLYEDMNNSAPARNNNSISPKGADTYASTNAPAKAASAETEENSGKHELPQTGEKQNEAGIFGILAMVLGLFGLADRKKKKDE
ncbi:LPXTG cell wall anchor domain-containing protein [Lactobacillus gallinarum]|nr:LPXTG cell wall anchor domain-containing protein [Lactobacillus gallinarum]